MKTAEDLSPGLAKKKEMKQAEPYVYSAEERKVYDFYTKRFQQAKEQRNQCRDEFDGLTYEDDYQANYRALISYLRPKLNDDETRIKTGTTEYKVENRLNSLIGLNLQPEVLAFDQNDTELSDLGDDIGDVVKRSNELETDEPKWIDAWFEMLSQRIVYIQENWVERDLRNGRKISRAEKKVIPGHQVYPADLSLPYYEFSNQPFVVIYERMMWVEAEPLYSHCDNWKYVKAGTGSGQDTAFGYRMNQLKKDEVEILHYYSYTDNEYQVMINGVMMFELASELPWEYEGYNLAIVVPKTVSAKFLYGKSMVSSAKTLQALDDEMFRLIIRQWQQAVDPPMGVKGNKIYSRDIWSAGKMVQGVKPDEFFLLNPNNQGVTGSAMNVLQFVESKTAEFMGQSMPSQSKGKQTATEIVQRQKEAINMLGLSMISAMMLVKNATYLRIYNELENSTKLLGREFDPFTNKMQNIYRKFTIGDTNLSNGSMGKKVVQFMDRTPSRDELNQVRIHENQQLEKTGVMTKLKFINWKKLNALKVNWFVSVISKERDSSELAKVMFTDKLNNIAQVSQLTGRPVNPDKIIEETERIFKAKDLFQKQAPQSNGGQMGAGQPQAGQGGANQSLQEQSQQGQQMKQGFGSPSQVPSINTALGNV